jgi:hypothetical protein
MGYMWTAKPSEEAVYVRFVKGQERSLKRTNSEQIDVEKTIVDYIPELRDLAGKLGKAVKAPSYVSENILPVFLGGLQRAYDRKANKNCLSKYLSIIKALHADIYDFGFIITLPLDKLELLHRLNGHLSEEFELGKVTEEYASWAKKILSQQFTLELQQTTSEQTDQLLPTALWPQDKEQGEKAADFLRRIWGTTINKNQVSRSDIRTKNLSLYQALSTNFRRNSIPKEIEEWWNTSPIRSKEEVDKKLESLGILNPEDAFNRGLDTPEAHRLYNAALRRKK